MRVEFYPDGAVARNGEPGLMGLGVVARWTGGSREFAASVYAERATSNRAELLAIIHGLEQVPERRRKGIEALIFSDSEWAVKSIRGEYHATANLDLIQRARSLLQEFASAEIAWVRGHCGHRYNERANTLAQRAARRLTEKGQTDGYPDDRGGPSGEEGLQELQLDGGQPGSDAGAGTRRRP